MALACVLVLTTAPVARAGAPTAKPVDTLDALGPALAACFTAPDGSAGSQITVRLSLTRTGAVLGRPRITFSHLVGPADAQRRFVEAVLRGLDTCTPVPVSPGLGQAIAGRPLTLRFVGGGPARAV